MSIIATKYKKEIVPKLKKELKVSSELAVPRILKVVLNVGVGRLNKEANVHEAVTKVLSIITGQKPQPRPARKSIASFKTREGTVIGYRVTLRGARMYGFLDRLINVVLPRTRDFRGINTSAVDAQGNLTIGLREHTVFPELAQENVKLLFGLEVTVVTTAKNKERAFLFLKSLGFPLKNE
jgi:large subunit ribosomal protein L5